MDFLGSVRERIFRRKYIFPEVILLWRRKTSIGQISDLAI